jgi:hypothetical protein
MIIKIYNKENNHEIGEFKIRNNAKSSTIHDKVMEYINKNYESKVRRMLPTGKIDMATGISDISYLLFGENLPEFRRIFWNKEGDKNV